MSDFSDFGELYRAAFAEDNPEKKSHLLKQVRQALLQWEDGTRSAATADATVWLESA